MKLDYLQALKRVDEARGAWIMQGQEPLLEQNLLMPFEQVGTSKRSSDNGMTSTMSMTGKMSLMHSIACPYFQASLPLKFMAILSPMLTL